MNNHKASQKPGRGKNMEPPIEANSIMNAILSFKENSIELAYKEFVIGYQQKSLRFFQLVILTILSINWLLNPLSADNFSGRPLLMNLLQIFLNLVLAIYLKYKKNLKHPQSGILLLQICNCVVYVELMQRNMNRLTRSNFISISLLLELNSLVSMIARSSWKINTVSAIVLNTYLSLRFADLDDNEKMRGLPAIVYFGNFLIITFGAYFHEKYDRNLFYQRFVSENSLKRFEEIIKEVLPSSIIIYKEKELKFFNEETTRMLKVDNVKGVEDKLRQVMITSSEYKLNADEDNNESLQFNREPENLAITNELEPDLYRNLTKLMNVNKRTGFLRLSGSLGILERAGSTEEVDGELKYLDIKIGRIVWEGSEALIAIISEDLALNKLHYYQEQVKYKDKLLATVSHDLRTPLNGIIGILDLVLESDIEREMRKNLQLALRSSNLLLFMINDILDFSQIANGRLSLTPVNFCLEDAVRDISKLIKFQAKKKNISFEVRNLMPKGEKYFLYNDPNRLKQIILNILGNAVKFTQKGYVAITLELENAKNETNNKIGKLPVKISVEDSGCGIKQEDIPKLFKLFGRLNTPEAQRVNTTGVGLGLAISQNLVRILNNQISGAEITVKSEYGKGTLFSFPIYQYPEYLSANATSDYSPSNEPLSKYRAKFDLRMDSIIDDDDDGDDGDNCNRFAIPKLKSIKSINTKKKVLLVDDDQINILVLTKFFEKFEDCTYFTAFNGEEALAIVRDKANSNWFFDIIFMDCNMPVMDGFEATRRIMDLVAASEIPNVFIVASTANASESDKAKCFECGMIDFISKPFTKRNLREKIDLYVKF